VLSALSFTRVRVEGCIRDAQSGDVAAVFQTDHAVVPGEFTRFIQLISLKEPKLWQPNGSGEPCQYEIEIRVIEVNSSGEALSDSRVTKFGIRKVEWANNMTSDGTALPYTFVVNGKKTYIKGWNWVPIDVMYGVDRRAKLERLIRLAREAGVNMLRVWGGGLIEKDAFYEQCSRYGIMVWQEFIQSSSGIANAPSEDPDFIAMMTEQAEQIIPRKRNHASLVLWCGGNELQADDGLPLNDSHPVLAVLKRTVERLHPDALWLATSPTGPVFGNTLDNIRQNPDGLHDVHGPWEHQGLTAQYELYNQGTSLLHSEFGVEGMTRLRTLNRTISPEQQWPASKDNPVYFHRGAWWTNEPVVQQCFGGQLHDIATLVRASQFLQAEGLRYAVESNRRRIWQNSGTLPWQFNEPYPNAYCTSALDYYACPKSVYYGIARAYRTAAVTASFATQAWSGQSVFAADIWAVSDAAGPADTIRVTARVIGLTGQVYTEQIFEASHEPNSSQRLGGIETSLSGINTDLFVLDLDLELKNREEVVLANNRYLFTRESDFSPLIQLPASQLELTTGRVVDGTTELLIRSNGPHAVIGLQLEDGRDIESDGYVYFSENDLILLPGESLKVLVVWTDVPSNERIIEFSAWNKGLREPTKLKDGEDHV
jgi:beta-mannosidase